MDVAVDKIFCDASKQVKEKLGQELDSLYQQLEALKSKNSSLTLQLNRANSQVNTL